MNLQEAKVLITGGSSGIGFETARLLVENGAKVAIASRNEKRLEEIARQLGVVPIIADVSDETAVQQMTRTAIEKLDGLNVLINNAGFGYMAPLTEVKPKQFYKVIETNIIGTMLCAKEAAIYFKQQNEGNIINIGSTAALNGSANSSPYVATKFAVKGMTECWRAELRPFNIRVMLVNPSEVMTNFATNRQTNTGSAEKIYTSKEQQTKLRSEEVAHTIVSLLKMDNRGFITEATIFATNPQV